MIPDQLIDGGDGIGFPFQRLVFGNEGGQRFLGIAGENLSHPSQPQFLDNGSLLAVEPAFKGGKFGADEGPFAGFQDRFITEYRLHHRFPKVRKRLTPGRIDTSRQRQGFACFDGRKGQGRNLLGGRGKILGSHRLVFFR